MKTELPVGTRVGVALQGAGFIGYGVVQSGTEVLLDNGATIDVAEKDIQWSLIPEGIAQPFVERFKAAGVNTEPKNQEKLKALLDLLRKSKDKPIKSLTDMSRVLLEKSAELTAKLKELEEAEEADAEESAKVDGQMDIILELAKRMHEGANPYVALVIEDCGPTDECRIDWFPPQRQEDYPERLKAWKEGKGQAPAAEMCIIQMFNLAQLFMTQPALFQKGLMAFSEAVEKEVPGACKRIPMEEFHPSGQKIKTAIEEMLAKVITDHIKPDENKNT